MEIFTTWLVFASVNLAATMWPGPAFALTVRNALVYNRHAALLTVVGLGFGVGAVILLLLCGFSVLLTQSTAAYNILRYAGGAYLFYLGVKALLVKKHASPKEDDGTPVQHKTISCLGAFQMGFFTNLLNAKGILFLTAIYTQFITPATPLAVAVLYLVTSITIETGWLALVATLLSAPRVKQKFLGIAHWIERVCGGLLILLGIRLALGKGLS